MRTIESTIELHVVAGTLWLLTTLAIAAKGHAPRWLLVLQVGASLATLLAGIGLWHTLHAGRGGTREHILAVGTFCALIAIGPQAAIAVPAILTKGHPGRLRGATLALGRLSAGVLILAAAAMVGSTYV